VVYESGGHLSYLYFSTTSIVSLLYDIESGASRKIAILCGIEHSDSLRGPLTYSRTA